MWNWNFDPDDWSWLGIFVILVIAIAIFYYVVMIIAELLRALGLWILDLLKNLQKGKVTGRDWMGLAILLGAMVVVVILVVNWRINAPPVQQTQTTVTQTVGASNPCLVPNSLPVGIGGKLIFDNPGWTTGATDGEVYSQPRSNSKHITTMFGLDDADIIDGPICEHGNVWWKVKYNDEPYATYVGWAKEVDV